MSFEFNCVIIDIDKLTPDPENANIHSKENIDYLRASLREFGWQKPLVVSKDLVVYAGNGTLKAAKEEGFKQVPVAMSNLPIDKLRAFSIADNEIAKSSNWDLSKLSNQLQNLSAWNPERNWTCMGFNPNQLSLMLSFDANLTPTADESDFKPEKSKEFSNKAEENKVKYKPLRVNDEQMEVIQIAIKKLRDEENDQTIPDGRAIELICAEYIS